MNKNQSEQASQDELDLGLNAVEPITPKKSLQPSTSIFDKAKGIFAKKEQAETDFHVRKEPTFGDESVQEYSPFVSHESVKSDASAVEPVLTQEATIEPAVTEENSSDTSSESTGTSETDTPITPAAPMASVSSAKAALTQPEKWKILQILPAKHRRLFAAILALVALLIVFFALKPNSDTVESFTQNNSNEIPVQFQSLDQNQPVETSILDNPAPQPMVEQANTADAEPKMEQMTSVEPAQQNMNQANTNTMAQSMPTAPAENAPVQPQFVQPQFVQPQPVQALRPVHVDTPKPVAPAPVQTVKKTSDTAVSHKVENVKKDVKKADKTSTQTTQTTKTNGKAPIVDAKPIQVKKETKVQVVDAKPVAKSASSSASSKTLTVPKGVSLMQVFRDNHLNISDVNAMSKAAGAGNALSSFKPGDKVAISVNSQGRVAELRMSNGARFIRQADGSYQYKK